LEYQARNVLLKKAIKLAKRAIQKKDHKQILFCTNLFMYTGVPEILYELLSKAQTEFCANWLKLLAARIARVNGNISVYISEMSSIIETDYKILNNSQQKHLELEDRIKELEKMKTSLTEKKIAIVQNRAQKKKKSSNNSKQEIPLQQIEISHDEISVEKK